MHIDSLTPPLSIKERLNPRFTVCGTSDQFRCATLRPKSSHLWLRLQLYRLKMRI